MPNKNVLESDFDRICQSGIDFKRLTNSAVMVTGATGFIGSLIIKFLIYVSSLQQLNIKIIALVRNFEKARSVYAEYLSYDKLEFLKCDLSHDDILIADNIDYIIHAASVTTSKTMVENPTEVIRTAVNGTEKILKLALNKRVKSIVYLSSMEVYGSLPDEKADETKLGFIDLANVRSCYPESKRLCECMCFAYSAQFKLNIKIARLAQTFGAGILPGENRVFAQFARSVINKKNIVLHTKGLSEGNYVYSSDAVTAILILLLSDSDGIFNINNEQCHMTIAEMADTVCNEIATNELKVEFDIPDNGSNLGYAPTTKLFLDSSKIRQLGWIPKIGMVEAYKRMIAYMVSEKL